MPDVKAVQEDERYLLTTTVLRKLATDRAFRDRFTASADDGERPIHVALPQDNMAELAHKVVADGGHGNLVIPYLNGVVVITMRNGERVDGEPSQERGIASDCTVGLFLARLTMGGTTTYEFESPDSGRPESGEAEIVAFAG